MKKLRAFFSGTVQGVGFRYTAERMARRFPVAGYVRNLPDGRVEVVAEGEEANLQDFLQAVREAFHSHIRGVGIEWSDTVGENKGFGIRF